MKKILLMLLMTITIFCFTSCQELPETYELQEYKKEVNKNTFKNTLYFKFNKEKRVKNASANDFVWYYQSTYILDNEILIHSANTYSYSAKDKILRNEFVEKNEFTDYLYKQSYIYEYENETYFSYEDELRKISGTVKDKIDELVSASIDLYYDESDKYYIDDSTFTTIYEDDKNRSIVQLNVKNNYFIYIKYIYTDNGEDGVLETYEIYAFSKEKVIIDFEKKAK